MPEKNLYFYVNSRNYQFKKFVNAYHNIEKARKFFQYYKGTIIGGEYYVKL